MRISQLQSLRAVGTQLSQVLCERRAVCLSGGASSALYRDEYQQPISRHVTSSTDHVTGWTDNNRKLIDVFGPMSLLKLCKSIRQQTEMRTATQTPLTRCTLAALHALNASILITLNLIDWMTAKQYITVDQNTV